ncbi:MAG: DUF3849 domain-containing protein [Oscillospiraceae bacterium]|jgi:hypothetical protein|nr:DUF3849 domain-containing protein [Oscillospiraceae bacterium]
MAEHKQLYRHSFSDAVRQGETDQWRASHAENIACRDYIDQSIALNYQDNRLNGDVAEHAIARFGFDRVNWVLANTLQRKEHDGRFSTANKEWAKGFHIPRGDTQYPDRRADFVVDQSHPGLVDMVARHAREAYEQLHLFSAPQCQPIHEFQDVAGHVLVLRPEVLADEFKTPECQLFLANYGNGCRPSAIGRAIYGRFLCDGEQACFNREDFFGALLPEHLPDWAIEKMREPEAEQTPERPWIKVFQINVDRDAEHRRFEALKESQQVDASIYDEVYSGPVASANLESIFAQFNEQSPALHRGRSMCVSDVIEVNNCHFYVNPVGYRAVEFDASQAQKPENLLKIVMIEPDQPAYEAEIFDDLKSWQRAVGGCIEVTYPFEDNAVLVGNDEAKLLDMQGNRHIGGQIYAGAVGIVGGDGENFCSLTDEQAEAFCEEFAQPEEISQEEVQGDMGIIFYGM